METPELLLTVHPHASAYHADLAIKTAQGLTSVVSGAPLEIDVPTLLACEHDSRDYGARLGAMVFASAELRSAWSAATEDTPQVRVRLAFSPGSEQLQELCWERLCLPAELSQRSFIDHALSLIDRYAFAREIATEQDRAQGQPAREELRALVIVASPRELAARNNPWPGFTPIDRERTVQQLSSALPSLSLTLIPGPTTAQYATIDAITQALGQGYDLVYLVCHGAKTGNETRLMLEDRTGRMHLVPSSELIDCCRRLVHPPRLFVFAACYSASQSPTRPDVKQSTVDLAPGLIEAGVSAVVAMQGPILADTAHLLLPTFLREVWQHGEVDRALATARNTVASRPDWWMPTLSVGHTGHRLWFQPQPDLAPVRTPPYLPAIGRERLLKQIESRLLNNRMAVALTGPSGVGKSHLARAVGHQLRAQRRLVWVEAGPESDLVEEFIAQTLAFFQRQGWIEKVSPYISLHSGVNAAHRLRHIVGLLAQSPVVIILDQVEGTCIDKRFDELLDVLGPAVQRGDVTLLLTSTRPDKLPQKGWLEQIPVPGIAPEDIRSFYASSGLHALAVEALPVPQIHALALGGNPLALMALGHDLLKQDDPVGAVVRIRSQSLYDLIARELRDLSDDDREVLRAVTVLKPDEATATCVAAVVGSAELAAVTARLRRLSASRLLEADHAATRAESRQGANAPQRESYVLHPQRVQLISEQMPEAERVAAHRRAAAYYEQTRQQPYLVAYHLMAAGELHRAAEAVLAHERLIISAGDAYRTAALIQRIECDILPFDLAAELLLKQGDLLCLAGRFEEALTAYRHVLVWSAKAPDSQRHVIAARAYIGEASARVWKLPGAALLACDAALKLHKRSPLPPLILASLYVTQADAYFRNNSPERLIARACKAARRTLEGDAMPPLLEARLLLREASILGAAAKQKQALARLNEARLIADLAAELPLQAQIHCNLGTEYDLLYKRAQALEHFSIARVCAEAVGDMRTRAFVEYAVGTAYLQKDDFVTSNSFFQKALALAEEYEVVDVKLMLLLHYGLEAYYSRRFDAARGHFERAEHEAKTFDHVLTQARALYRLAQIDTHAGELARAFRRAVHALELLGEGAPAIELSYAHTIIGDIQRRQKQYSQAEESFARALALAPPPPEGDVHDRCELLVAMAYLALATCDLERAKSLYQEALAIVEAQPSVFHTELVETLARDLLEEC